MVTLTEMHFTLCLKLASDLHNSAGIHTIFQDHQLSAPSKYYNFSEGGRHQVLLVPSFNSVFAALGNSWISQHLNDPLSVSKVDSLSAQCFKFLFSFQFNNNNS